jgi:hypothetical protein
MSVKLITHNSQSAVIIHDCVSASSRILSISPEGCRIVTFRRMGDLAVRSFNMMPEIVAVLR